MEKPCQLITPRAEDWSMVVVAPVVLIVPDPAAYVPPVGRACAQAKPGVRAVTPRRSMRVVRVIVQQSILCGRDGGQINRPHVDKYAVWEGMRLQDKFFSSEVEFLVFGTIMNLL